MVFALEVSDGLGERLDDHFGVGKWDEESEATTTNASRKSASDPTT